MLEKELFHEHLSALYDKFGQNTVFISLNQAAKYCRMDSRTLIADKTFPLKIWKNTERMYYRVPLINFARWLS